MVQDDFDANTLIDEIDSGELRPRRHAVIRALHHSIAFQDDDQRALIAAYDKAEHIDPGPWGQRIWSKIELLPLEHQGGLRLCVGLLQPDSELDWYEAEYFILWARQQGVTEQKIAEAFRHTPKGS